VASFPAEVAVSDRARMSLAQYRAAVAGSPEPVDTVLVDQSVEREEVALRVAEAVATLDPGATLADRASVLEASVRATSETDVDLANTWAEELDRRLRKVRGRVADRRVAAMWVAALEAAAADTMPQPPFLAAAEALRDVVRDQAELTVQLREQGEAAVAEATRLAEQRLALETVMNVFHQEGFEVHKTDESGVYLSRSTWNVHDLHLYTQDNEVHWEVVQTVTAEAENKDSYDTVGAEHCAETRATVARHSDIRAVSSSPVHVSRTVRWATEDPGAYQRHTADQDQQRHHTHGGDQ
jgi:hypothetical protein